MSRSCQVCGGLVPAANEVLGYSGPICSGQHQTHYGNAGFPGYLEYRVAELEQRVFELTQRLSQQDTRSTDAKSGVHKIATGLQELERGK